MDRFAGITAFVQVADSGGFTAAARRLNLSTTTVSEHVQALEDTLGVRLLNRTSRHVSLTDIGHEYYERCAQILQELEEADELASALQTTPRGRLRVYCHQGLGRFIEPVITGFLRRYPEVAIDLRTGDAMIDLVEERFDVAVMPFAPRDSTLVKRRLAGWRYVLCCAPRYLERHPPPQSPADLREHNCLLYTYSFFGHQAHFLDADGNPVVVPVSGSLVSTSLAALRGAAVSGVGLWMCAPYIVSDLLASGALVPLLVNYGRPELEIVALYPHRRHLTAKVRVFIDMLVERFADERYWLDPTAA